MAKLLEIISDLNDLVLQGKVLEAFEKYYHEEVIIQENEKPPTIGKKAYRAFIKKFLASVTEFRSAKRLKVAIGQGTSMVEWQYDYSHKDYGEVNYIQISVQNWENGKIVKEKFYYNDVFNSKSQEKQEATLIVLFNLKEGVSEEKYQKYAVEIDSPTIKRQPSNLGFKILKGLNLFKSKAASPYQYIEVMNISSFDELAADLQKGEVKEMLRQFSAFADKPQLIVTKQIN